MSAMIRSEICTNGNTALEITNDVTFIGTPASVAAMERALRQGRRELQIDAVRKAEARFRKSGSDYDREGYRRAYRAAWGINPVGV